MKGIFQTLIAGLFILSALGAQQAHARTAPSDIEASPCRVSITALRYYYDNDEAFKSLIQSAFNNQQHLPVEYKGDNPWLNGDIDDLIYFFIDWCKFLPTIEGTGDTGLKYIQLFAWFYYRNESGVRFVQEEPGKSITQLFAIERGAWLDSPESTREVANWLEDARIEKEDYKLPDPSAPDGGFKSWNAFFSRTLNDQASSRPQTMPERDYIIAAPTDCIMNSIPMTITDADTRIPTKLNQALNISEMLDGSSHASKFVKGTAVSCVLMPNTYHHYHSPVSGHVIESRIIGDPFYGYDNFPKWVPPNGNVGYYGTDFSQFENFQRGYFIVDTGKYGHVAMIPVGLDTISSIQFKPKFRNVTSSVPVERGEELGYFLYGGSLFIMIFEPGRYSSGAIQVRLGNQIGTFDTKSDK